MAVNIASKIGLRLLQGNTIGLLSPAAVSLQHVRQSKHWNPKWKHLRRLKVIKVKLPKYNENPEDLSEEEIRSRLKEQGLQPRRPWMERQFFVSATGAVFEPYVPPEGDGKVSPITAQGAKQKVEFLQKKTKTMMAIRKISSYEEDFNTKVFCDHAAEIYKKSHEALMTKDKYKIAEFVTERALPEIMHNIENKTIRWKFLKDVELPRIVHARCTDIVTKENIFGQVTVRFHTQQSLAIYDRFGRLMHGSEIIAKDVLEYVVFEKHLANEYGVWRVHDKIIPDWLPPKQPSALTYKKLKEAEVEETTKEIASSEGESKHLTANA